MDSSTTLLDTKAAFLRQQVRLLSQPVQPSTSWRDFAPETEHDLSDKTIEAVMTRVNEKLKQHTKNVYSAMSQRYVAEQIDALYWNQVTEEDSEAGADALAVARDTDLTTTEVVEGLPDDLRELQLHPNQALGAEDAARYAALRKRLADAIRKRDEQRRRLEGYRRLKEMLEPLEDVTENVQPNLVTRDGELSRELDRMRVLLARVKGKFEEMTPTKKGNGLGDGITERQRVKAAMDLT